MNAGSSLALLTDLYELTMACAYWKSGLASREGVFHLFFRRAPFRGGFTVACGLGQAIGYLRDIHFENTDWPTWQTYRARINSRCSNRAFSSI